MDDGDEEKEHVEVRRNEISSNSEGIELIIYVKHILGFNDEG